MTAIGGIHGIGMMPAPQIGERTGRGNHYVPQPIPQGNFFIDPTLISPKVGAIDPVAGRPNTQQQVAEIGFIGAQKAQGFQNGLGGTNNRDNHKIFYAA